MEPSQLFSIKSLLEHAEPTPEGIARVLSGLGYPLLSESERLLASSSLLEQKELRERVKRVWKLFSERATWKHPVSGQTFDREATIILFELTDDETLRSRWTFELTRYVVRFALQTGQAVLFFIAPNSRTVAVTSYEQPIESPDRIQVRRLLVDLENIARTDLEILFGLRYDSIRSVLIEEFRNALPYLKVGREFFREYHELFQLLSKRLTKIFGSAEGSYGYAQRLLGRIAFLYFLQRKGWLDGDRAYLRKRSAKLTGQDLFDFLYKLFEALNTEDGFDSTLGRIPFLNGSLFEPDALPLAKKREIRASSAPVLSQILAVFNQYNFTITESTPLDKEVAVDPELLGSLFESMLPESERGDKGTFYTHQDEMLFMAREALRCYLTSFPLIDSRQAFSLIHETDTIEKRKLEPKIARELKDVFRRIKILDPAVGSGGFLIAALQSLLAVREKLNKIIGIVEPAYDAKLEMIENNLFGVDIEYEAIELARLRLWLSLIVDEAVENVRPLPNLDFNLHQGDSLKIPPFEKVVRQTKITSDHSFRDALLRQISQTREEYNRSHGKAKDQTRQELEKALRKLIEVETGATPRILPFSYKYFFPDIMGEGGFDVVMMNPPYIQQEDVGKLPGQDPKNYKSDIAEDMKSLTGNRFSPNKQSDISIYFHIRSISLLKKNGVAVVISTNKWLDTRYGVPFQEYLLSSATIESIYDSAFRSFAADVNTAISVIRRGSQELAGNPVHFVYFKVPFREVTAAIISEILAQRDEGVFFKQLYRMTVRTQTQLYEDGLSEVDEDSEKTSVKKSLSKTLPEPQRKYVGTKWGNLHLKAPPVFYEIINRLEGRSKPLGQVYFLMRGTTTGSVDFFLLKELDKDRARGLIRCRNGFSKEFWLEDRFCPPVLIDPEDIEGYVVTRRALSTRIFKCNEDRDTLSGTRALQYIRWAEEDNDAKVKIIRGENRGKLVRISELPTVQGRAEWYQLPSIEPPIVMLPNLVKNRHVIPLSPDSVFSDDTFIGLYVKRGQDTRNLWLYLNSAVFRLFMELNGRSEGAGALHMMVYEYKQCPLIHPLPNFTANFRGSKEFASRIAYRIVNISEGGPLEFQQHDRRELDDLVLREIGFDKAEERVRLLDEIYKWLEERVRERLTKPKTGPESAAQSIGRRESSDLRQFQ